MIRVDNKRAVRRLADKSFRASRTRNLIAVIAIALTTVLFTTLFALGLGMVDSMQEASMRQAGGGGHAVLKYVTDEQYQAVKDHRSIEMISYNRLLADDVLNPELLKRHGEFYYMDDAGMELSFCQPTGGHKPVAENEIMADTKALKLLGVPQQVGAPVRLTLDVKGEQVTRDFVLSGWWEADPVFDVSILVTSRAYVDAHLDELQNTMREDRAMAGVINCYIMFGNSFNLQGKLDALLADSGFQGEDESAPDYMASNINWAYLSSNFSLDPGTILAVAAALALIIFTGYLIIYNIFQLSVIRDIRFYGLLKTIGATGKQLRTIIRRQALVLSIIAIPMGLVLGYLLGTSLVPAILEQTIVAGTKVQVSPNPMIFIGSAVFALITVWISTRKPGKIAAGVSPVEAVRYTDGGEKPSRKAKKSTDGGKLPRMALSNLSRNRTRTVLVVLSMCLSLVLLNTVFTITRGFDMEKYLARFTDTDFLVAHADYFRYRYRGPENGVTESMISAIQAQPGFEEGGRLYSGNRSPEFFRVDDPKAAQLLAGGGQANYSGVDEHGSFFAAVYGLEELPLSRLRVLEGEIDWEKLKTGDYILEGVTMDDNDRPYEDTSHFDIGDQVTLHNYRGTGDSAGENAYQTRTFTVMAKVAISYFTASDGNNNDYAYYLPAGVYLDMVDVPGVMSYAYNVKDGQEAAMERFVSQYTETAEPMMSYSSKQTRADEFEGMRQIVMLVGGALSLIIGLVGVLNFVNSVLTSIVSRRREFATLEAIGMTRRQLSRMLRLEGLYYAGFTIAAALALGVLASVVIVNGVISSMWFFSYRFILWPLLAASPILLALAAVLPPMALNALERQSVVERLREE